MLEVLERREILDPEFPRGAPSGARAGFLAMLTAAERHAFESAASPSRPVYAGCDLMREGAAVDLLHILVEGWACRYKTTRDGGRQIVAFLLPGDLANVDSLLLERPDYGVRALSHATVLAIPRERALAFSAAHTGVARAFTLTALVENAILSQWTLGLGRLSAQRKLAHLLCEFSARLRRESDNRSNFAMPLTQEHLADALGLTSVHVNRTMQQLRADELVATQGRVVAIPDLARLRDVGEFDPAYLHLPEAG